MCNDIGDIFDRKRTFSEKCLSKQRVSSQNSNYSCSTQLSKIKLSLENNQIAGNVTDTNYRNLNSSNTNDSLKQGNCIGNSQLSITLVDGKQLSTIYDILQSKKLDTSAIGINSTISHSPYQNKTRFLVRKITEEELFELRKEESIDQRIKLKEENSNKYKSAHSDQHTSDDVSTISKKHTKSRRFSNILTYSSNNKVCNVSMTAEADGVKCNENRKLLNDAVDNTYARLNRSYLEPFSKNKTKSSSMENMIGANVNEEPEEFTVSLKLRQPYRKSSVPVNFPPKILPKKSTRRLSEFTRGEFLNEKL